MPSSSPTVMPGGVATCTIKANGSAIPTNYLVNAIRIEQSINRISVATISLLDGSAALETFAISQSPTFVPGVAISIELGYNSTNTLVFSGIVVKQTLQVDNTSGPVLEIECMDQAVKMVVGRKSAGYSNKKDSDVISTLISAAGLSASVATTTTVIPELVQYYVSDWDFMLTRAEVNSMVVSTINGKVSVFNPTADTTSVLTLAYGVNLLAFSAKLDCLTQLSQVKASAWDYASQALIQATAPNNLSGPGNLSSKTLAQVVNAADYQLQTSAAQTNDELSVWAQGQILKSELSKIIGEARFQGMATIVPGQYLSLDGAGSRFDGDHFVSGVRHDMSEGNWITEVSIGLSPLWFVQENQVEAAPAAGLLPGISGLFNGTVKKIDADPDSEYRILVEVALFNDSGAGLWARLSNFYSTNGQGVFFLPEIGDEVILGFLNQDPRYPVILGSLYSQKNRPYSQCMPNDKNSMKAIVTKSELRIMFDDENKILTVITPANNKLVLDDKNKQIQMEDDNGNSMVMSSSGITIKSDKDITLQAGQQVTIKGTAGVTIQSSQDVDVKGMNINETADMNYAAKGNINAQVQGGAELTLKAAMVMIN